MKSFSVAVVALIQAYTSLAASGASTVVCDSCPSTTASAEYVTRTSGPTTPCSAPTLTAVYASGPSGGSHASGSGNPTSTSMPPPITNSGNKAAGSLSGAALIAVLAAGYVLH